MELHNNQVPGGEVWAVVVEDGGGVNIEWFLTAKVSSDEYRDAVSFWEQRRDSTVSQDVTVTRWYIELPRRGIEKEDVDSFVEFVVTSGDLGANWRRRLDFRHLEVVGVES